MVTLLFSNIWIKYTNTTLFFSWIQYSIVNSVFNSHSSNTQGSLTHKSKMTSAVPVTLDLTLSEFQCSLWQHICYTRFHTVLPVINQWLWMKNSLRILHFNLCFMKKWLVLLTDTCGFGYKSFYHWYYTLNKQRSLAKT